MSFPERSARIEPLLVVADLARSLGFWVDQLSGQIEVRWDSYARVGVGSGGLHLAVTGDPPPDRTVQLIPPPDDPTTAHAEVVIQVEDCTTVCAKLTSRGARLLGPPAVPPWGGETRAFLRDPDNHLVEITSPLADQPATRH